MITLSAQEVVRRHELPAARRSPRIAYFAGTMRPGHDGVTRVLYQLIAYLKEHDIQNVFFSPIVGSHQESIHQVPSITFPLYKDYRLAYPGQRHFEGLLQDFKPDLLHINSPCSLGYAAVKYAHRMDIPVVATYHTHFASYAKYYSVTALEALSWSYFRKIYNGCQRVFVPSQPVLLELQGHGIRNLEFIPHGVDTNAFHPRYRSSEWRTRLRINEKTILLYVGRLVWEKDLRTLAEAYRILSGKREDLAFVLIGDGPIRRELQACMPEALFLGYQSGHDLSTAYASSDLFVFPSTTETFGNVTLEAMASGIAPICAGEGGSAGLVLDGRTGLFVVPRDPGDLALKIAVLANDKDKRQRIARDARCFAQDQSWDRIFDRLLQSYDRVIDEYALHRLCRNRRAA